MSTSRTLLLRIAAAAALIVLSAWSSAAQEAAPLTGPAAEPAAAAADPPAAPAEPAAPAAQAAQPDTAAVNGFRVGGFTFKPGGRIKLDVIRDFKPIGNEDSFDTRTIPLDGSEGTNSNLIAKESRLSLDIRGPAEGKELQLYFEGDFYGTSSAFRLRMAYGRWGRMLAGQTWSTFMDEDNLPRTIDFESPTAFAQIRQAQLRYTQKLTKVVTWYAAVEDNKSAIVVPSGIPGKAEYPSPDLVTKFRFDIGSGHVSASAFWGQARFRPTQGDTDSVSLWGTMLSANFKTWGRDTIYGVVTYGDGIGRYRGGTTAVPDEFGELHAVGGTAFMGGYEHFWKERWSSNAVYSIGHASDEPFFTSSINKELTYGAVNLLWWFLGDRGWMGVEYLYGHREVYADTGDGGSAHRLQYAVRFNLP